MMENTPQVNTKERFGALKEKVRDLNEKYKSEMQKEEKAKLWNQLEQAKKELEALEEKLDSQKKYDSSKPEQGNLSSLKILQEKVRDLNEKYNFEIQKEAKTKLWNQLEQAKRELEVLKEELDQKNPIEKTKKEHTPSTTPTQPTLSVKSEPLPPPVQPTGPEPIPPTPSVEPEPVPSTPYVGPEPPFLTPTNIISDFNPDNRGFFGRMSERAKKIATGAYEGLYKIPIVNKMVGKLEIAYNQYWIDRHEEKAVEQKGRMDGFDVKIGALDHAKSEIESMIENLGEQKLPGIASLQLKLKVLDAQKAELLGKKDKAQSKFEKRENKSKLYMNKRDQIADRLIDRYDEKLKPMEKELERLQTCREEAELFIMATNIKHDEELARLKGIENKKTKIEDAYRSTGMSEKQIRNDGAVKALEEILTEGREKIRAGKTSLEQRKAVIDKKIAKVDAKANPYRDKREQFVRVKAQRPVKMEVPVRERGQVFRGTEDTRAHIRAESSGDSDTAKRETSQASETSAQTLEQDSTEIEKEKLDILTFITEWNVYLRGKHGENVSRELVNQNDFLRVTGFSRRQKLEPEKFKALLERYYKWKKLPMDKFTRGVADLKL